MSVPQLDLILARAFYDYPVVWTRLAASGISKEGCDAAFARYRSLPPGAPLVNVTEVFGVEPIQDGQRLRWPLALWPAHEYRSFTVGEAVFYEGIRYRLAHEPARAPELSVQGATSVLRLGLDTDEERARALGAGEADEWNGWSPEAYYYHPRSDGSVLRSLSIYGVLVSFDIVADIPRSTQADIGTAPTSQKKWWKFW